MTPDAARPDEKKKHHVEHFAHHSFTLSSSPSPLTAYFSYAWLVVVKCYPLHSECTHPLLILVGCCWDVVKIDVKKKFSMQPR